MTVLVEATALLPAPPEVAFEAAAALAPTTLLPRRWPMPGCTACAGAARWTRRGDERRLRMSDGGELVETLIRIEAPQGFCAVVSGFHGWFAGLARDAESQWRFTPEGDATRLVWRIAFRPAEGVPAPILALVVKPLWPGYMRAGLSGFAAALAQRLAPADGPAI